MLEETEESLAKPINPNIPEELRDAEPDYGSRLFRKEAGYTIHEKTEALIRLALNNMDWNLTATQTGVPPRTLRKWHASGSMLPIPGMVERALQQLLALIPRDMSGRDWAVAVGVLMDKWIGLANAGQVGEASTQGSSLNLTALLRMANGDVDLGETMSDEQLADVIAEAERILTDGGTN